VEALSLSSSHHSSVGDDGSTASHQSRHETSSKKLFSPFCVVFLIAIFYYWPLLAGVYSIFDVGPDITVMAIPDLTLRAKALMSGVVPIWDPYEMGGQSPLGEVTPAVLDPVSYPLLLMPLRHGHINLEYVQTYYVLLHCLAGLSAYFLIRDLVNSALAAVIAGIFYAIGGVPGNAIWFQVVTEAIYAPLILSFLFRGLRGNRPLGNTALAGALLGLSWFSGSHHIPIVLSLCCGGLLLFFSFFGDLWRGLLRLIVFTGVMFLVSAPQVIPALQWGQRSMRWVRLNEPIPGSAKVPFLAHLVENVHPSALLSILISAQNLAWQPWQPMLFTGLVVVVFATFALSRSITSRLVRMCLGLVVVGALMTLSEYNMWYGVAYLLIPMFDKLRESAFWIFLTHIGLTCLLGLGVGLFLNRETTRLEKPTVKILAIAGSVALAFSFFCALFGRSEFQDINDRVAVFGIISGLLAYVFYLVDHRLLTPTLAAALALGLIMIEHGNVGGRRNYPGGHGYNSQFVEPLLASDSLAKFLRAQSDLERIDVDRNDVAINFGDYQAIEEMSSHGGSMLTSVFQINFLTPRARQLYGVNYYVARKPSQPDQVELFTAPSGIKVFRNPNARPRVWSVHRILSVADYKGARELLSSDTFDMVTTSFVNGEPPQVQNCANGDRIELLMRTWFSAVIRANMACVGMVVLNDNWYLGWRATVDGQPVQIYPAYMTVRGVVVSQGNHVIEMHYRPRSFYLGCILFAVGFAVTLVLLSRTESQGPNLLT
jgi:hypothetical protein